MAQVRREMPNKGNGRGQLAIKPDALHSCLTSAEHSSKPLFSSGAKNSVSDGYGASTAAKSRRRAAGTGDIRGGRCDVAVADAWRHCQVKH